MEPVTWTKPTHTKRTCKLPHRESNPGPCCREAATLTSHYFSWKKSTKHDFLISFPWCCLSLSHYIFSLSVWYRHREKVTDRKLQKKKQAVEWILTHGALIWLMIWRRAASIPQASWRHAWKCSYQTNRWQKLPTRSSEMRRTFHHFQAKMRETSSSFSQVPLCLIAFHSSERCE